jgi:hypothetical protein
LTIAFNLDIVTFYGADAIFSVVPGELLGSDDAWQAIMFGHLLNYNYLVLAVILNIIVCRLAMRRLPTANRLPMVG